MKRFLSCFSVFLAVFCLLGVSACGNKDTDDKDQTVAVAGVTLDKTEAVLKIGETVKLTASVSPENATEKTVTWTSSSNAVATVSGGTVTAVSAGTANITAAAGGKNASCSVTVLRESDKVTIGGKEYETLSAAIAEADDGAVIEVSNGTYQIDESISVGKAVTIRGEAGYTVFETASEDNVLTVSAEGVTIEGITFSKTNKQGASFSFIHAERNDLTVKNCTFTGKYENGDNDVTRAMVFNAGVSGYLIEGNTFKALRQPAYLEGSGTVKNNSVEGTKGFVVCCNYKVSMEGNTFKDNATDIAIIENNEAQNLYTEADAVKLSSDNNGAFVDLQPLGIQIKNGVKVTE